MRLTLVLAAVSFGVLSDAYENMFAQDFDVSINAHCTPYTAEQCRVAARKAGLEEGGNGYEFEGDYYQKGCYAYSSGTYAGQAFYGTGGSYEQISDPNTREDAQYRPFGWDCSNLYPYKCSNEHSSCKCEGTVILTRKCKPTEWTPLNPFEQCNEMGWSDVISRNLRISVVSDFEGGDILCKIGFGDQLFHDIAMGYDKKCFCHPIRDVPSRWSRKSKCDYRRDGGITLSPKGFAGHRPKQNLALFAPDRGLHPSLQVDREHLYEFAIKVARNNVYGECMRLCEAIYNCVGFQAYWDRRDGIVCRAATKICNKGGSGCNRRYSVAKWDPYRPGQTGCWTYNGNTGRREMEEAMENEDPLQHRLLESA